MTLDDRHREDLKRSGLTPETIAAAGLYSATAQEVENILGFAAGPGLAFPYRGNNGDGPPFIRIKPDSPYPGADGRPAKYLTPKGAGNRLFVPPRYSDRDLQDVRIPLIVTEGEKKALKGAQDLGNFVVVGLAGVWCFKDKENGLIADFGMLRLKGRHVAVAYDSDVVAKPQVREAESALARELDLRGAHVRLCRIPAPGDRKMGLDDYLLAGEPEAFVAEVYERALVWSAKGAFAVETAGELAAREIAEDEGIVGSGILPGNSIAFVTGYAKAGKSLLMLQLGMDIATGEPFLGRFPVPRPRRVLYVQQEVAMASMADRVRRMLRGGRDPGDMLKIVNLAPVALDTPEGRRAIENVLAIHRPEVLELDPFFRLHSKDENDATQMTLVIEALESFRRDYGVAIVVAHHHGQPSKDSGRRGFQLMRGSSVLAAVGDAYLTLTEAKGVHSLAFTLRNAEAPDGIELHRDPKSLRFEPADRPKGGRKVGVREIVAGLMEMGGEASRKTLVKHLRENHGVSEKTVTNALGLAAEGGKVKKRQEGKETVYRVARRGGDDGNGNDGKLP